MGRRKIRRRSNNAATEIKGVFAHTIMKTSKTMRGLERTSALVPPPPQQDATANSGEGLLMLAIARSPPSREHDPGPGPHPPTTRAVAQQPPPHITYAIF